MKRKQTKLASLCAICFCVLFSVLLLAKTPAAHAEEETGTETAEPTKPTEPAKPAEPQTAREESALPAPAVKTPIATSKGTIKLSWKAVRGAKKYKIYRAASKNGTYRAIGSTAKTAYTDKKGKANKTYYYRISSLKKSSKTGKWLEGAKSAAKKGKVRKAAKRIAYAGDSITVGFSGYRVIGRSEKVFAKRSLNASTFYNSSLMKRMLKYKPDRLYMMFGMNGLVGRPSNGSMDTQIKYIKKIIKKCKKRNPNMEIVILGVSPTGAGARVKLGSVSRFNKRLRKGLKSAGVHYYNPANVLANKSGYLNPKYSGGDGIHWNKSAYKKVRKALQAYVYDWK